MANQPLKANVIGLPHIPSIKEVNVRSGPSSTLPVIVKATVGTKNLPVIAVKVDQDGRNLEGKVYQWFQLSFPNGQVGWARDDLIEVFGDGSQFGYTKIANPIIAFNLMRQEQAAPAAQPAATTTAAGGQQTAATPAAQPAVTSATADSGPPMAMCMGKTGARLRSGPGTNNGEIGRMGFKETGRILEVQQSSDGVDFKWAKIDWKGKQGWTREDFLRLSGNFGSTGLAPADLYPSPAPDSWWGRDYDSDGSRLGMGPHHGWDHSGNVGAPILAGPQGGKVTVVKQCAKCGPEGQSTVNLGYSMNDSRIWNDPQWNFGYGHYIIVRYDNNLLPESTKQYLASQNMAGGQVHVMYAHLKQTMVQQGATVTANQQIGTLGNSGNSTGPHLHLEVRIGTNPNAEWYALKSGLRVPSIIFLR